MWKITTDKSRAKQYKSGREALAVAKAYDAEHPNHMALAQLSRKEDEDWIIEIIEINAADEYVGDMGWLAE